MSYTVTLTLDEFQARILRDAVAQEIAALKNHIASAVEAGPNPYGPNHDGFSILRSREESSRG